MDNLLQEASQLQDRIRDHRRWLHEHAEVGFELPNTLAYVEKCLREMGYTPEKCGQAGLVATISGGKNGKTILLRADMDALPIPEESGLPFSCTDGRMHACGHDMHTAMLLGAARLLMDHREQLKGTVKLLFQPAEEIFEGARDMIENGALEPSVDAAVMIHVMAGMPLKAGTVIVSAPGVSAPAADYFTIRIQGKGCHGSAPQNGVDALTAGAHTVIALQELTARELAASGEAVLTVGTMHAGTAPNAIADTALLEGTLRTYDEESRAFLKQRLEEISRGIADTFRASAEVTFGSGCPTLCNDAALSGRLLRYLQELLGDQALSAAELSSSRGGGSEDFAYFSQRVPSVMLALAAGEPDKGYPYPQHHPQVKFDESVLSVGAAVFAHSAIRYLQNENC